MSRANQGSKCEVMPRACSASNRWIPISLAYVLTTRADGSDDDQAAAGSVADAYNAI